MVDNITATYTAGRLRKRAMWPKSTEHNEPGTQQSSAGCNLLAEADKGAAKRALWSLPQAEHCQSHCNIRNAVLMNALSPLTTRTSIRRHGATFYLHSVLQFTNHFYIYYLFNLINHPWRQALLLSFYWWRPLRGLWGRALTLQCLSLIPGSELTWASHLASLCFCFLICNGNSAYLTELFQRLMSWYRKRLGHCWAHTKHCVIFYQLLKRSQMTWPVSHRHEQC